MAVVCGVGVLVATPALRDPGAPARAAGPTHVIVAQVSDSLGWAANYIAQKEGFFRKEGLDVEISIAGGDVRAIPALISGNVQFAAATCLATLQAMSKGADFAMVAPMTEQFVVEFIVNREAATRLQITPTMSVEDKVRKLKGMKVGVPDVGGSLHLLLNGLATKYGLDPNRDFTVSGIGPAYSTLLAALKRGDIDLAATAIPFGDEAVRVGYATMFINFWKGEVPAYNGAVHEALFVGRRYAREHPDVVEAMRRAIGSAITLIQREPARALEDLAQTFPALNRDIVQTIVVAGGRGYPRSATIPRKGFEIVRDFTAENVSPSVRDVTYEKAVWPSAQEK